MRRFGLVDSLESVRSQFSVIFPLQCSELRIHTDAHTHIHTHTQPFAQLYSAPYVCNLSQLSKPFGGESVILTVIEGVFQCYGDISNYSHKLSN